ncbi:hypothetical protein [Endozoicomonas sp. 8E]|uniref:hypothetical protein n=1 Tax=Endozoicomonas sp. 8E TaxID=3035692 RepID=UPI002939088D|nr:hypothetical protein [Endozoicomonas sp. 8E]WOG27833.1 hypothetical protein P6910_25345 [Endozoicomonas sp. 8E]
MTKDMEGNLLQQAALKPYWKKYSYLYQSNFLTPYCAEDLSLNPVLAIIAIAKAMTPHADLS